MPRWCFVFAVGLAACVGTDLVDSMIAVDEFLTPKTAFLGFDPLITGTVAKCDGPLPVTVYGDGIELMHLDSVELILIEPITEGGDRRPIFRFVLPVDLLPASIYGLPAVIALELETECNGQSIRSMPYTITYIPTHASTHLPEKFPSRFWPDQVSGDLIACSGLALQQYTLAVALTAEINLGFLCTVGEMTGEPEVRRYLTSEGNGIAAVDPGPIVPWKVRYNLRNARVDATGDPIIIFKQEVTGSQQLVVLDRDTGDEIFAPIDIDRVPLGQPFRNAIGELLILEAEAGDNTRTYFVHRYDALGGDIGEVQVAHYDWSARSYVADFDPTGRYLYLTVAPVSEENRALAKVDLEDCPGGVCTTVWETPASEPWYLSLGEYDTRVLAASDAGFVWLNAATGAALTGLFGPASGNRYVRGTVEDDGSIVMIADPDPLSGVAQGLYLFDPQGNSTLRYGSSTALFRWLTPAWGDGVMISFFGDLHLLHSRSVYDALRAKPSR